MKSPFAILLALVSWFSWFSVARADTLRVEANSPGATPEEENTVAVPTKIVPREDKLVVPAAAFPLELAPWSMNVLRIPVK
jgi:hypothetical protein